MRATPRSLVVILWSLVALAPFGVGACHVGETPGDDAPADGEDDDDGTTGPDASTDDGSGDDADGSGDDVTDDDGADDGGAIDVTACRDLVPEAELIDGHHPDRYDYDMGEEKGCVQNACHSTSPGPAAPVYTLGGAVYQSDGGRPVKGATVYVTDDNGITKALVTSANGFFWSTDALTPPLRVAVTAGDCPTEPIEMQANATGNCNGGGGCHNQNLPIFPRP